MLNRKSATDDIEENKVYHVKFSRIGIDIEAEIVELDLYLDIQVYEDNED